MGQKEPSPCPKRVKGNSVMVYDVIEKEIKSLPADKLPEVLNFIAFVKYQASIEALSSDKTKKRKTNTLAGGTFIMAEDFDETPECFKEYTV